MVLHRWILRFLFICILQLRFLIWANLGADWASLRFYLYIASGSFFSPSFFSVYPYSFFSVLFSVRFGA